MSTGAALVEFVERSSLDAARTSDGAEKVATACLTRGSEAAARVCRHLQSNAVIAGDSQSPVGQAGRPVPGLWLLVARRTGPTCRQTNFSGFGVNATTTAKALILGPANCGARTHACRVHTRVDA